MTKTSVYKKNLLAELKWEAKRLGYTGDFIRGNVTFWEKVIRDYGGKKIIEPLRETAYRLGYEGKSKSTNIRFWKELVEKRKIINRIIAYTEVVPIKININRVGLKKVIEEEKRIRMEIEERINVLLRENKLQEILDIFVSVFKGSLEYFTEGYRSPINLMTTTQINIFWNKLIQNKYILKITTEEISNIHVAPEFETQYITLGIKTKEWFIDLLSEPYKIVQSSDGYGSDIIEGINIKSIVGLELTKIEPNRVIQNRDGKFFPYINTTDIDLSRYQIFNQKQAYELKNKEHCLIHCLKLSGVDKAVINNVKLSFGSANYIKKKDLKIIAKMIRMDINIYSITTQENTNIKRATHRCGPENNGSIHIAIFENHYFLYEESNFSKCFINNYDDLKEVIDRENIVRIKHNRDGTYKYVTAEDRKINSLLMIYKLFRDGKFEKLDMSRFDEKNNDKATREHIYLNNIENEQKEFKLDISKAMNECPIYFADCESYVQTGLHELAILGVTTLNITHSEIVDIYEGNAQDIVNSFLKRVSLNTKNSIVYFHNLKYDYHLLEKYLNIRSKCTKDGHIYNVKVFFNGCIIELRDSYKMIPLALHKFCKTFRLKEEYNKKEAIAYKYYNRLNIDVRINTSEYKKLLPFKEQKIFDDNMKTELSYDSNNKTFNPWDYYRDYLRLDCLVLKEGMIKFNELILAITKNISIYTSLTISSLTDTFMKHNGAYNGVYEVTGNLRTYIAKAVYGGRVACNKKYVKQNIDGKIADYDGVSLYPSAIKRLCKELGLPKGKARLMNDNDIKTWMNKQYAIMTVKINKVNKHQQIPFIAYKSNSSINYLNEPPPEPVVIDKYTLEDYIEFHEIDYEIIEGVYWNKGGNPKMGEIIQTLFNERLKCKEKDKDGKPKNEALSNVLKLMLNSAYGKTIMKPSDTKTIVINSKDYKNYIYNNFNTIKSFREMNKYNYEIKMNQADISYNRAHIGCAILSYSKRIMNEVFDVANTNNLPIYYTDTDSLHCNYDDVKVLEKKFEEKYVRILTGKNLGQFHVDFDLPGAKDEIYATKSIFLGKKSYLDCLESKDENGNIIRGYHIRLKGVTVEGLENEAKKYKDSYFGLYSTLAKGQSINMLLNPHNKEENKEKVLFEFKNGSVYTKTNFYRKVKF